MNNTNICSGCRSYEEMKKPHVNRCLMYDYRHLCPCRKCIVKGVCYKGCEERKKISYELNVLRGSSYAF
jgi:hypothetical protein